MELTSCIFSFMLHLHLSLTLKIFSPQTAQCRASSEVPHFPPQAPHPLEDNFGMFASCVMLEHSLNPGITAARVQFGTIRKTRSALSNYSATTRAELTESVLVGGKNKGERWNFSATPMHGLWFNRFKDGCHSRMGDDIRPTVERNVRC
jgi:hypothetical protein